MPTGEERFFTRNRANKVAKRFREAEQTVKKMFFVCEYGLW